MNKGPHFLKLLASVALLSGLCVFPLLAGGAAEPSAAAGKTTIVVWDQYFPQAQNKLMNDFVASYESSHPSVVVRRTPYDTDSIRTVLRPALSSGSGPDLFYYDAGPAFLGQLSDAGLVYDLTTVYQQKGWDQRLVKWAVERVTYHGKIWGVPNEIEYTNIWYNKDVLQKLGMADKVVQYKDNPRIFTLPSFDDFAAILQRAKAQGIVGTVLGNSDPGRAGHWFSYLVALTAGKQKVDGILFGNGRWDSPEILRALQLFKQVSDQGYFNTSPNAVSFDEANALFFAGKAATNLTGTWLVSDVLSSAPNPDNISFFMAPPADPSLPLSAGAGIGSAFGISATTKNAAGATDFLDYLMTKEAGVKWLEEGSIIPPINGIDIASLKLPELMKMAVAGQSLPLSYNLDVVMPAGWNDAMKSGLSAIISGTKTPQQVASDMQAAWESAKARGDIWKVS